MNKVIPLLAFSILLLVPIGAQQVFATHLSPSCPPLGELNSDPSLTLDGNSNFCVQEPAPFTIPCFPEFSTLHNVLFNGFAFSSICAALLLPAAGPSTPAGSCQDGTVLDANDHCVCEQQNNQCVGGVIIDTDTVSLLASTIGIDPLLTGLIGITIAGLAVQAVWFVHRRRKSENS